MRITGIKTVPMRGRALLLMMYTDEGIVGFGEPMNYEHWRVVSQAVEDMADYLVGKNPMQIENHWQTLYRSSYSRSMPILVSALSGIEMAMWDIMGKVLGVPVWKLLGGSVRNRIRMYTGIKGEISPQEYVEDALRCVAEGFTALKMVPIPKPVRYVDTPKTVKEIVMRVAAVREAVGDEVDVAVDFHRRLSPAMSIMLLKELEPLKLLFAEEPCHPENNEVLLNITRSTTVPVATGERHLTRWGFREIIERGAARILQPDIRHAGGILETKKIASMAETHQIAVAPHNAAGPVGVAASVQVMATVPNFLICEGGMQRGDELFDNPLMFRNGYIDLPTGPGLGIDMQDKVIEAQRDETYRQRRMFWFEDDGSFADC